MISHVPLLLLFLSQSFAFRPLQFAEQQLLPAPDQTQYAARPGIHTDTSQFSDKASNRLTPFDAKFDAFVEETIKHLHIPGISISIVDNDATFAKGYGMASLPDVKATENTLYYPGSTTNSFTAAAYALLIEDTANTSHPLQWSTPISSLIRDDFVLMDDYATTHATMEDALSHRTGFPGHDFSAGGKNTSLRQTVRSMRNLPSTAEIRTRFQYCNLMYVAVSHVIETLTGMWLGAFLRTRLWEPLAMRNTYFSLGDAQAAVAAGDAEHLATGYTWQDGAQRFVEEDYMDMPEVSGAGSMISTVTDYAAYLRFLLSTSPPLLPPSSHLALRSPHSFLPLLPFPCLNPSTYAFGWTVTPYRGHTLVWHTGGLVGFSALILHVPSLNWGAAVMGNTGGTSADAGLALVFALLDAHLHVPAAHRCDWVAASDNARRAAAHAVNASRTTLYPHLPRPLLPPERPLPAYAGTYRHAAYGALTFAVAEPDRRLPLTGWPASVLRAEARERTWASVLDLEHVSGAFWVAWVSVASGSGFNLVGARAEFRVGPGGGVVRVGIGLEPEMGEELVWFERVGG